MLQYVWFTLKERKKMIEIIALIKVDCQCTVYVDIIFTIIIFYYKLYTVYLVSMK